MWSVPTPTALCGSNAIARALDLDRRSADRLVAAGLLGETFETERGVYVHPNDVQELGATRWVDSHPDALVIRLGAVQTAPNAEGRPFLGWHSDLAKADWATQLCAIDRWWAVRDPEPGLAVVFTVSTFVVHVATLAGSVVGPGGLRILEFAKQAKAEQTKAFVGQRVYTGRGGNTVWLTAQS